MTVIFAIALCTSCHKDDEDEDDSDDSYRQTVIVYMAAENNLSVNASSDINELKSDVKDIPEDCQIVVYIDDYSTPRILLMRNGNSSTYTRFTDEENSADPDVLLKNLQYIKSEFPSQNYSLILWSHGNNWDIANTTSSSAASSARHKAVLMDSQNTTTHKDAWMDIDQIRSVLEQWGQHLTYLMFDACNMQSIEVAAELSATTDYIIGSPGEIPGNGAPYNILCSQLCNSDIQGIVCTYGDYYANTYYPQCSKQGEGVLLSAVKCSEVGTLCNMTAPYINSLFQRTAMADTTGIQIYSPRNYHELNMPICYDIRSTMAHLLDNEQFAQWDTQWAKTILYPRSAQKWETSYSDDRYYTLTDPAHYGGISMNIPMEDYRLYGWISLYHRLQAYTMLGWDQTGW